MLPLGMLEYFILLAATGRPSEEIAKAIRAGRFGTSPSAVRSVLIRLGREGLVRRERLPPRNMSGGRARFSYTRTAAGERALATVEQLRIAASRGTRKKGRH